MGRGRSARTLELVEAAREILAELQPTTVRGVCYRLFTRGLIASMEMSETRKVSRVLTEARESGDIPWEWICDETRAPEYACGFEDKDEFKDWALRSFRLDAWQYQPFRVEVWSEKGTVRGILRPVLDRHKVTFRVFHGWASATSVKEAAIESQRTDQQGKHFVALYVGDWDPSGLYMSEVDLPKRLKEYGGEVDLQRVALTRDDVRSRHLPHFDVDTKDRDPRFAWYTKQFRRRAWELDAMDANDLRQRVDLEIQTYIDPEAWERCRLAEQAEQNSLEAILSQWPTHNESKVDQVQE